MMKKNLFHITVIFFILAVFAVSAPAQILNTIRGTITDKESGAPLAEVTVIIVSTRSAAIKFELSTDANGYFYKGGLETGTYQIRIEKSGYIPVADFLRLSVGETKTVENALERMKAQEPSNAMLLEEAVSLINQGEYQQAMKNLDKVLQKDPENPSAFYYSGLIHERGGETGKAAADLEKAIALKEDFTLALAELGKIRARKRDFTGAETLFKKAYLLGANDPVTLFNYASTLINLGRGPEAGSILEKLLSIDPDFSDAYYELAIINLGKGDQDKTRELLEKYLDLAPQGGNAALAEEILKTLK